MDINKIDIVEIAPGFRFQWEEVQDCFVVLYPEGMVKLSKSAGEILKRVDGEATIESIINDLETSFSESNLEKDVLEFMEVAYDTGWIRNKK
jgi:pyrroloquinoline quinone biosynthesis protein D